MARNMEVVRQQNLTSFKDVVSSADAQRQLKAVLPSFMPVEQLARISLSVVRYNPQLQECSPQSLLVCVMGCARLGLLPEPFLGQAYFVPFWNSKLSSLEATLIPGYRGYITLGRRSGDLRSIASDVVYSKDHFRMVKGLHPQLEFIPADADRGDFKGAWNVIYYRDGFSDFEYMTAAQINEIKERTKSRNKKQEIVGPWVTDEDEMRKKTVIRRHLKTAPLAIEDQRLHMAARAEEIALTGESQKDFFLPDADSAIEVSGQTASADPGDAGAGGPDRAAEFDKAIADRKIDAGKMAEFVSLAAAQNHMTDVQVKTEALEGFDEFLRTFNRWVELKKQAGHVTGADPAPATGETPAGGQDEKVDHRIDRKKWLNLHAKNFRAFVEAMIEHFRAAPADLRRDAVEKWDRHFPDEPCPIHGDQKTGQGNGENLSGTGPDSNATKTDTISEGDSTGESEIVQNTANGGVRFGAEIENSRELAELMTIKQNYPEIYQDVVGKTLSIATIEDIQDLISKCDEQIDTLRGAGGGIPDGDPDGKF